MSEAAKFNYVRPINFGEAGAAKRHTDRALWHDNGAGKCAVTYVRTPSGGGSNSGLHIHDVEQVFYLLSGEMFVEVDGEQFTVQPGSLVVFPAGVPHRNWNEAETEHLVVFAPAPEPGQKYTHELAP